MKSLGQNLISAVASSDRSATERLLKAEANPNYRDVLDRFTALHRAIEIGDVEIVQLLLLNGADVQACDNDSYSSPLGMAVMMGNENLVRLLLEHGAILSRNEIETGLMEEARSLGFDKITDAVLGSSSQDGFPLR